VQATKRKESTTTQCVSPITQPFLRLPPSAVTLHGCWISPCRVTCAETPSLLVSNPHPPGPIIGGTRAPCRLRPTNVALRQCSWAAAPPAAKGTRCQTLNTSTQGFSKPDAFCVFKFDTPKTSWGHIWLPSPRVQLVFFSAPDQLRQIYLREIHLQILDLRGLFGCNDNGAGCRHLSKDLQFFEKFGAKFAAIFRSRHGRGPACLLFIGGWAWDQILAPELNSISAKKDHKLLDTVTESLSFRRSVYR